MGIFMWTNLSFSPLMFRFFSHGSMLLCFLYILMSFFPENVIALQVVELFGNISSNEKCK